jgi:hypothetical protein
VSGGDGTGSSTQVPIVRCALVTAATFSRARHLMPLIPEVPALVGPTQYRKPLGEAAENLRMSQVRGKRQSGLAGSKILSTHNY